MVCMMRQGMTGKRENTDLLIPQKICQHFFYFDNFTVLKNE